MAPADSPSVGQFGPDVIGEEAFAAEKKAVAKGETVFGPDVLEHPHAAPESPAGPTSLSVRKLEDALKVNPALVGELLDAEIARPEGARPTALKLLLRAERSKGEGGEVDEALIARIQKELGEEPEEPAEPEEPEV